MGRSITPKYRLEVIDHGGYKWQTAFPHRATKKNLETFVTQFNKSVLEGHNKHLGSDAVIHTAKVVCQKGSNYGATIVQVNVINIL
jgi:hypothetical protein